ncbi:hypothetical protein, partial [Janthinobacterium sp. PSPC3-1]|uniref:hypothetical protein n=1 Tax=Janthinobacterium sp. PSPC3-1 TaxID=2804653 RepID=UPI003CFBC14E
CRPPSTNGKWQHVNLSLCPKLLDHHNQGSKLAHEVSSVFVYMMNCSDAIKSAGGDCDKVEVKILWKTEIRLTFRQLEGVA